MPRGLSVLPLELLVNILQSLSSSRDLYAIIRTSSQFYRIFAAYKQSILSAILLRAISKEVETDFILAQRAQRIWKLVPEHETARDRRPGHWRTRDGELFDSLNKECTALLDQCKPGKGERLSELVSDRMLLLDLWKFHCNFEQLMVSYSTRAFSNLRQSSSDSDESLSFTEQTRLQRAFFRWEVYTCLFQISQVFGYDIHFTAPPTDPAPRFAAMFRSWEVEEISCVAQFYKSLVEELSDRIEEDFVTAAKEKMHTRATVSGEENGESGGTLSSMLDLSCLWWYKESFKRSNRSGHIDYLVSRGMLCVRKLISAPFAIVRKMVVKSDLEARRKIPMLPGLEESDVREEREGDEGESVEGHPAKNDSGDKALGRRNFGWLWAVGHATRLNAPANYELRNQGYVFWDKERLLKFEKFQSPRVPVRDFSEFPSGYQEHSDRPGIETKLKNYSIHWEVVDEIYHEINGRQAGGDDEDGDSVIDWRN